MEMVKLIICALLKQLNMIYISSSFRLSSVLISTRMLRRLKLPETDTIKPPCRLWVTPISTAEIILLSQTMSMLLLSTITSGDQGTTVPTIRIIAGVIILGITVPGDPVRHPITAGIYARISMHGIATSKPECGGVIEPNRCTTA